VPVIVGAEVLDGASVSRPSSPPAIEASPGDATELAGEPAWAAPMT
jgi:hypothetical protein